MSNDLDLFKELSQKALERDGKYEHITNNNNDVSSYKYESQEERNGLREENA